MPDVEQRELDEIALAMDAEDVAIDVILGDDALLLPDLVDRGELVAVHRRELEVHRARGRCHAIFQLFRELVVPAVEEHRDRADLLVVPGAIDLEDARRGTSLDLVLQARTLPCAHLRVGAGPELEVLVDEMKRPPRGRGGVVRAEEARRHLRVEARTAHDPEARPLVLRIELQRDVVLVVAELDVPARPVLLDEIVLEDRGFFFGARDDRLEVAHRLLEERDEVAVVTASLLEVAPHARPERLRLADVDDGPLLVLEEVDARLHRQRVELFLHRRRQHAPTLTDAASAHHRDNSPRGRAISLHVTQTDDAARAEACPWLSDACSFMGGSLVRRGPGGL